MEKPGELGAFPFGIYDHKIINPIEFSITPAWKASFSDDGDRGVSIPQGIPLFASV